jgi:hypothetical protein
MDVKPFLRKAGDPYYHLRVWTPNGLPPKNQPDWD